MATVAPDLVLAENVEFETFLGDYAGEHVELVDGRVIKLVAVNETHDKLTLFLSVLLDAYLETTGEGQMRHDKFTMRTFPERYGREPDVLVVTTPNLHKLKETYVDGAADLVIEVISPESIQRDRGEKFTEYEAVGVREYWIVDPHRKESQFYVLEEDGYYRQQFPNTEGIYQSHVLPRLKLAVALLHETPLSARQTITLVDQMLTKS